MKYEEAKAEYEVLVASGKSITDLTERETILLSAFKLERKEENLTAKRKAMRGIPPEIKAEIKAKRKALRRELIEVVNQQCFDFVKSELANVKTDNSEEKAAIDEERKVVRSSKRRAFKSLGIEVEEAEPVDEDVAELIDDDQSRD